MHATVPDRQDMKVDKHEVKVVLFRNKSFVLGCLVFIFISKAEAQFIISKEIRC